MTPKERRGWRVLDVTATSPGHDGVGILSSVCLPLASLPLMNVSTLDHSFVLLPGVHVDTALELLGQEGEEELLREGSARRALYLQRKKFRRQD